MQRALFPALFAAGVTFLLTCLVIGVRLEQEGPNLTVVGADAETWSWIGFAVIVVFLFQLFQQPLSRLKQRLPSPDVTGLLPDHKLRARLRPWLIALVVVGLFVWPFMVSRGAVDLATLTLIYVMLGLGLNIVVGFAGLLDLGYVAFYAVGAYTYALLSEYYGLSFWVCLPIAGLLAATFGCILGFPVLRLRGDYLAIVTLGFGEIIRILLNNWTNVTGGPNGIGGIEKPSLFGLEFSRRASEGGQTFHEFFGISYNSSHKVIFLYLVAVLLVLLTIYVINRIQRMPIGRAWEALREDEIACRSLGLNPTVIKLSAFTMGASFAGFAGCFFAARQGFISPESFTFIESAIILAIVVLGGMGSQLGVILAAIAMTILPELAREFQEYRMLMFGGVMVLMMLWRPQGLLPMKRPHLELKTS
ncbi:high-affinity branched-chain amino acid ABC transporter permease LivM [Marinobacterium sediminicola]|uniref:L-leucine ABC transporter membrane protein /L-isoleucine ABC transporter membrane protein /L-valine ABC transporter membrane protein n=1 Tax=Marinobacterium sediminicola TaxID=518898 RepID=A0ABY1S170_9GAMM|nr:high-affinity branched-chain amino acid ABC transporter permease LivM [Marinobacterium sediminicola]ULG69766.1 high-affinity branched-chain amino acid ABC transporter permease LivM [Marinobacterium sediminicola]SMR75424.1 L-leucine ABC transporter membrane protein /L-isoleucine ABC transporter membrane protein /L-valine ABC transporter membrane protein [Marinobacterium sediminicola]